MRRHTQSPRPTHPHAPAVGDTFVAQAALLEAAAASGDGKGEGEVSSELLEVVPKSLEGFDAGMNDDLNTPR